VSFLSATTDTGKRKKKNPHFIRKLARIYGGGNRNFPKRNAANLLARMQQFAASCNDATTGGFDKSFVLSGLGFGGHF
jgi:hypothetical protein